MIRSGFGFCLAGFLAVMQAAVAAPPPIEAYGKLPGIEFVTMAPGGARYAFVATVGETPPAVRLHSGQQAAAGRKYRPHQGS
jgi:hypothetical protein